MPFVVCCLLVLLVAQPSAAQPRKPLETLRSPVVDRFHGHRDVVDDYRWLEEQGTLAVKAWVEQQNRHTQRHLNTLRKERTRLEAELDKLYEEWPVEYGSVQYAKGVTTALYDGALVVLESLEKPEPKFTLVDPEDFLYGEWASVDFYHLSPDGRRVAASVSGDGTEYGTVYVFDTATGELLDDEIPDASRSPGGDFFWTPNASGLFYTKYPFANADQLHARYRYGCQEIWFHEIGTPVEQDAYVLGHELPRFPQCLLEASRDGRHLLVQASNGAGGNGQTHFLRSPDKLTRLAGPADQVAWISFGPDDTLLVEDTRRNPRGELRVTSLAEPDLEHARVLVPAGEGVLTWWLATDRLVYAVERHERRDTLRVYDMAGKVLKTQEFPPFHMVEELVQLEGDVVLYKEVTYLSPPVWRKFDPQTGRSEPLPLTEKWPGADFSDCEVVTEWATSRDGTKVPVTVIRRQDCELDGQRPVYLTGYGGFKDFEIPYFQVARRVWLDHGGVWAIAHPRGEGELGEDWYRATLGGQKQPMVEDFLAAAEHLVAKKYTVPAKLAVNGGSHGGLLVGMALTQRPELFAAVTADAGVFDVLRMDDERFGPHTVFEYGSESDPGELRRMVQYAPLLRVRQDVQYPAVWLRVGTNDERVAPWHSWKMAAQLQATDTRQPVLLSTVEDEGHNVYTPWSDDFAFLFRQLGVSE